MDRSESSDGLLVPMDRSFESYPLELGIAYLFLAGYLVRTLFVMVGLPASVGAMLNGYIFTFFFQADILSGRDMLQSLAFFLVLLTAGIEISLKDLRPGVLILAILPALWEVLAIAMYARYILQWWWMEGMVLGAVLVGIGDGLVIPKMKEFSTTFKTHALPRLVVTWAPLEASFVLSLFGFLRGMSAPAGQESVHIGVLVGASALRIMFTLLAGAVLGTISGWMVSRRNSLKFYGHYIFTGKPVESFLMALAVGLVAFGIGSSHSGHDLLPMGFSSGSVFQSELLVVITGACFGAVAEKSVLAEVEVILGGVWVFGQLVLFGMIGSKTTCEVVYEFRSVLPIMAVGYLARFLGIVTAIFITIPLRGCDCIGCKTARHASAPHDILFCFLSSIPRAGLQGALGCVPFAARFFQHHHNRHHAQDFIFTAARLYILSMSVAGMLLLNAIGPRILKTTDIDLNKWCEHRNPYDDVQHKNDKKTYFRLGDDVSSQQRAALLVAASLAQQGRMNCARGSSPHALSNPEVETDGLANEVVHDWDASSMSTTATPPSGRRCLSKPDADFPEEVTPPSVRRCLSNPDVGSPEEAPILQARREDAWKPARSSSKQENGMDIWQFEARGRKGTQSQLPLSQTTSFWRPRTLFSR